MAEKHQSSATVGSTSLARETITFHMSMRSFMRLATAQHHRCNKKEPATDAEMQQCVNEPPTTHRPPPRERIENDTRPLPLCTRPPPRGAHNAAPTTKAHSTCVGSTRAALHPPPCQHAQVPVRSRGGAYTGGTAPGVRIICSACRLAGTLSRCCACVRMGGCAGLIVSMSRPMKKPSIAERPTCRSA